MDEFDALLKKYPRPWSLTGFLSPKGERLVSDANGKALFYIDPDFDAEDAGNPATALNTEGEGLADVLEHLLK